MQGPNFDQDDTTQSVTVMFLVTIRFSIPRAGPCDMFFEVSTKYTETCYLFLLHHIITFYQNNIIYIIQLYKNKRERNKHDLMMIIII